MQIKNESFLEFSKKIVKNIEKIIKNEIIITEAHMNLKKLRKRIGANQKEIATKIGITDKTYANYENGNTEPNIQTIIKLADYFHITTDELLGRNQKNVIDKGLLNDIELDIIDKLQTLDRDNQLRLQAYTYSLWQNQQNEQITIKKIRGNK